MPGIKLPGFILSSMAHLTYKTQLVELLIPAGNTNQTRFNFNDQPQLRNVQILSVETYNVNDITASPLNSTIIPSTVMQRAYLTLYVSNLDMETPQLQAESRGEYLNQIPLVNFHHVQNNQTTTNSPVNRQPMLFAGQLVDWSKCYVMLNAVLGINTQVSFLFNVSYRVPMRKTR